MAFKENQLFYKQSTVCPVLNGKKKDRNQKRFSASLLLYKMDEWKVWTTIKIDYCDKMFRTFLQQC